METSEELRERSLQEAIVRAEAFEGMIHTEGWKLVQAYYQNAIQNLANDLLLQESKPIGDLEPQRRELIGIRKLLTMIEGDIQLLEKHRKENNEKHSEPAGQ